MRSQRPHLTILLASALLTTALLRPHAAVAAATITVINLDGAGEGFNDASAPDAASTAGGNAGATLGAQRLIAFQRGADIWERFVDSSVTIRVGANFDPLFCNAGGATLGQAGASTSVRDFTGAPRAGTWYPIALANALFGSDIFPGTDDIDATFNSDIGTVCAFPNVWYYGLDANPPAGTIDFVTVVLHELGHGLGFFTLVGLATGQKALGFDDSYMLNLEDHTTGLLYPDMTDGQRVAASTATGELHWVGPEVVATGVGLTTGRDAASGHVEIYAPNPQESGSSVSHFSTSLGPNELMEPFFTDVDHGAGLAKGLMTDIGWTTVTGDTVADLGGDRTSDILWRNTSTGDTIAWLMNGFDKGAGSAGAPATSWQIEAVGDFDGIGKSDIVWRNTGTGATIIWQMNGFAKVASASIGAPATAWQVAGLGDFDGGGTADILWRNTGDGSNVIWLMDGFTRLGAQAIQKVPTAWQVAGLGDFDGDKKSDILWRNTGTGDNVMWLMDGFTRLGAQAIKKVPTAWQVAGLGDFDGDTKADILWRDTGTGDNVMWLMDGFTRLGAQAIKKVATAWQVACVGDYDGGGQSDILWRNTVTGDTVIWQMSGFTKQATGSMGAPASTWQIRC
jgi:hypothetical protein